MRPVNKAPSYTMPKWFENRPILLISLCALLYLLPGAAQMPLVDRDEPRFARATVEMIEGGNWIVPYFNGQYRFDKPPLTYWWMSLHYRLLGVTELAARLHSAIAAWLTALLTFSIARRIGLENRWATMAALIWLSSLQVLIHGRVAVADMPLILGITLSMRGIIEYILGDHPPKPNSQWFWIIVAGQSIAFFAKGPLAFLIPLLALLLFLAVRRKQALAPAQWKRLGIDTILGSLLVTAAVAAWGIPALLRTNGAYFDVGIGEHVVERGISSFNDRFYIPGLYYFLIVLIFFSPWVSALWPSLRSAWAERSKQDKSALLILGWATAPFIVFAFYKTQLPHYILPGYPALAILAARWMSRHPQPKLQWTVWLNRIVLSLGILSALILAVNLLPRPELQPLGIACISLALILASLLFASESVRKRATRRALLTMGLASILMIPFSIGLRNAHATVRLTNALEDQWASGSEPLQSKGFSEPSLVWYSGRTWQFRAGNETKDSQPLLIASRRWRLDGDFLSQWSNGQTPLPLHDRRQEIQSSYPSARIHWIQGFNPGNSSWIEIACIQDHSQQ